ncbi:hypothetical protein GGR28_000406 [Lewinella aquimaris]|uniref:S1/P1 nuclease n=1 Tax=Neolewinella aquimaris TaxID=1835722 RepID=A0A840E281_9BACT|nr:zinc dependent phospholipase C family protein [Neolewinella aquimaris]MBB4077805.1 hypothetical protein [Neolewinella aquimaris]
MIRFSLLCLFLWTAMPTAPPPWGFFGHRRINRLATFTLPPEMMPLFRANIDYLAEHAVDPDKRRYASKHEAIRHYIDLDRWGTLPFDDLPRYYTDALMKYATVEVVGYRGDTVSWRQDTVIGDRVLLTSEAQTIDVADTSYRQLWLRSVLPALRADESNIPPDSLLAVGFPGPIKKAVVTDHFSAGGILPYHLAAYHRQLTQAFVDEDAPRILRLAAEIGHYVGDAHVPLHTTENYNGQLTGQTGIHAFWESRLPELFADGEYDYFVGGAEYIQTPVTYYWDIVLESHALVDSVLTTERRLRERFPADQQFCYEERLGRQVRTQCTEFSRAWSEAMNGMVEDRFRAAIRSVGSVWYSCWVDAGQPDLSELSGGPLSHPTDSLPVLQTSPDSRAHE